MEQKKIDRISELTRISRTRELTAQEAAERTDLRNEYIAAFRRNLEGSLEQITIVDAKGNKTPLKRKDG